MTFRQAYVPRTGHLRLVWVFFDQLCGRVFSEKSESKRREIAANSGGFFSMYGHVKNTGKVFSGDCSCESEGRAAKPNGSLYFKGLRASSSQVHRTAQGRRTCVAAFSWPGPFAGTPCTRRSLRPWNRQNVPTPWSCVYLPQVAHWREAMLLLSC